jgi:hypothetical protein
MEGRNAACDTWCLDNAIANMRQYKRFQQQQQQQQQQ